MGIIEIGGTVGDIESLPFLEAIRQMGIESGRDNACYIHLTLVPYLPTVGEIKTVHAAQREGIARNRYPADVVMPLGKSHSDEDRRKIALFTNVDEGAVISCYDVN